MTTEEWGRSKRVDGHGTGRSAVSKNEIFLASYFNGNQVADKMLHNAVHS